MIQVSIVRLAGYGKWTLTLGSDREHELQALQASVYGELQAQFSQRGCLLFPNRHDEFFAVTSGLGLGGHAEIHDALAGRFEVGFETAIGHGETPFAANLMACEGRDTVRSLDRGRGIYGHVRDGCSGVSIMHLDVDGLTSRARKLSSYEITCEIFSLYSKMSSYFAERDSLAFFMGGDNFMVAAGARGCAAAQDFVDRTGREDGIALNCGIGHAGTAREAASLATRSLDAIREMRDSGGPKPDVYELSC